MSDPSKIKPCPFCGSSATIWMYKNFYVVECDNEYCGCQYGHNMELTEDEVIELWNKRSN